MAKRINMSVDEFAKLLKAEGTTSISVSQRRVDKMKLNARKNEVLNYILAEYDGCIRTEDIPNIARYFNATSNQIANFCASLRDDNKIQYIVKNSGYVLYGRILRYVKEHGEQSVYTLATIFDVTPSSIISAVHTHNCYYSWYDEKSARVYVVKSSERDEFCRFKHTIAYTE